MPALGQWLEDLQKKLQWRADALTGGGREIVFQFRFDRGEPIHLVGEAERFRLAPGEHPDPDITLFIDRHSTLEELLTGRLNGMDAFMSGRYRADGNIILSQQLLYWFRPGRVT